MEFIKNDGGRRDAGYRGATGDCVTRAIAIATGKPYQDIYDDLIVAGAGLRQTKAVRGSHPRTGVTRKVYERYITQTLGWKWHPTMAIGQGTKVHLKDGELPYGKLIVRLSKHLTAVVDGVIHDTFDPARGGTRCVYGYYSKN